MSPWPISSRRRKLSILIPRAEAAALRDCVAEALAQLTPREERILRMRFGIGMTDHTLEQVGKTFGLTRERIRQIEVRLFRSSVTRPGPASCFPLRKAERRRNSRDNQRGLFAVPSYLEDEIGERLLVIEKDGSLRIRHRSELK